jgi:dolichyl-phosphate beta-glucosyltransferase
MTDRFEQRGAAELPVVVIPCFNEEQRLDTDRLGHLASSGRLRLLFVNDGSTDGTLALLNRLRASSDAIDVLELARNVGKAEAVRRGLLRAVESGATIVGYYDADLATPPHELLGLLDVLDERPHVSFVMGARVALLGRRIERSAVRHYLGRVFATMAALVLRLRVYDTQCGAKVIRVTPGLVHSLSRPFRSSWVFDVELIGRLLRGENGANALTRVAFEEVPLREWHDVGGSKLRFAGMLRALLDLVVLGLRLNVPRRRSASPQAAKPPEIYDRLPGRE